MSTQPLIIAIGIAIVANLVIMGVLIVTLIRRLRPVGAVSDVAIDDARLARATTTPDTAAPDNEIYDVPEPSQESIEPVTAADDARRFRSVLEDEPHPAEQEAIAFFVSPPTALGPREEPPELEFEPPLPHLADLGGGPQEQTVVWTDAPQPGRTEVVPLPLVDEAVDWERRIREESERLSRYRRPVTVLLVELDGFERLVTRMGTDATERLIPAIAETLVRNGRATDHVARLGPSRFGVLMPETDEIQAINYAERIRAQCDRWLAAGAISTRVAIGWACPTPSSDMSAAIRIADQRLQVDRRRNGRNEVAS
jgi:diguanylate cyclase (GGDEF)-like protein